MSRPEDEPQRLQDFAREHVAKMDPNLRRDLTPWAKLMRMWHSGTDIYGVRITAEQRATLRRNIDFQSKKIAAKYAPDQRAGFGSLVIHHHLDTTQVKEELAKD